MEYHFGDVYYGDDKTYTTTQKQPLEWKVPGKKYKGMTYLQVMQTRQGRQYLKWWRDQPNHFEDETPEQKQQNEDFKKKHVANIDACFEVFDKYVAMERDARSKKRKSSEGDASSSDVPAANKDANVRDAKVESPPVEEPDSPIEKKSRRRRE